MPADRQIADGVKRRRGRAHWTHEARCRTCDQHYRGTAQELEHWLDAHDPSHELEMDGHDIGT